LILVIPKKAMAHFSAAIYNAHHGQPARIIQYHCTQAVKLSHSVVQTMLDYLDFATRITSSVLCESFHRIIAADTLKQYEGGIALTHPRGKKLLDVQLVDAISEALGLVGVNIKEQVTELRVKEHSVQGEGVDLLNSFYNRACYDDFGADPVSANFQVRSTTSQFWFLTDQSETYCFSYACVCQIGKVKS
jgi:hypothetical protein